MKKKLKGTKEFDFFQEFWGLHQDYYEPEQDGRYWDNLIANATRLIEKYANEDFGRFAHDLVHCVLENCDRKYRGKGLKYDITEIEIERNEEIKNHIKNFLQKNKGKTVEEVLDEL